MKKLRVLYFDLECRPGHWIGGDYVSKVITASAWMWGDSSAPAMVMTHYDYKPFEIADATAMAIEEADMVVGHYIRGFDLPLLNGELLRGNAEPLKPVLSLDTKLDLNKAHGRSKSQKNLAADFGLEEPKVDVTLAEWEAFNGREDEADGPVIVRVVGDVVQNMALRAVLAEAGWLGAPRVWRPESSGGARYSG
jgi:hypothetical protein